MLVVQSQSTAGLGGLVMIATGLLLVKKVSCSSSFLPKIARG